MDHSNWRKIIKAAPSQIDLGKGCYAANFPLVTMALPTFTPKFPFPWTNPKPNYLRHPWTYPTYDPKPHPYPVSHFATMHWTDRHTQRLIDGRFHSIECCGLTIPMKIRRK